MENDRERISERTDGAKEISDEQEGFLGEAIDEGAGKWPENN